MILIFLSSKEIYAQEITMITNNLISPFNISGYVEAYGSTAFSNTFNNRKSSLFVSHNRNDEPAVNLVFLRTKYDTDNLKANFALALGTYIRASYSAEPGFLKNLYEGNVALKFSKEKNIWFEIGIFFITSWI